MSNCVQCGLPVPDGQRTCSMCYGDVDHGRDGYYRSWLEDEVAREDDERDQYPPPQNEEPHE